MNTFSAFCVLFKSRSISLTLMHMARLETIKMIRAGKKKIWKRSFLGSSPLNERVVKI